MVYIQPWHGSGLRLWEVSPLLGKIVLLTIVILGEILCMAGEGYWTFVDNQPKLMWNTNRFWTEWWRSPWSIFCLSARWQSQGGRGDDFTSRDPAHQDPVCEWCWTTDIIGDAFVVYQQPDNFIFHMARCHIGLSDEIQAQVDDMILWTWFYLWPGRWSMPLGFGCAWAYESHRTQ